MPALITRIAGGNVTVTLSGLFMWCKDENSEFDGWEHNSIARLGVKYNFWHSEKAMKFKGLSILFGGLFFLDSLF